MKADIFLPHIGRIALKEAEGLCEAFPTHGVGLMDGAWEPEGGCGGKPNRLVAGLCIGSTSPADEVSDQAAARSQDERRRAVERQRDQVAQLDQEGCMNAGLLRTSPAGDVLPNCQPAPERPQG